MACRLPTLSLRAQSLVSDRTSSNFARLTRFSAARYSDRSCKEEGKRARRRERDGEIERERERERERGRGREGEEGTGGIDKVRHPSCPGLQGQRGASACPKPPKLTE